MHFSSIEKQISITFRQIVPLHYSKFMTQMLDANNCYNVLMNIQTLCSKQSIDNAINQLAGRIVEDHPIEKPLFVALLRGAAPFASKLMFDITKQNPDYHPELDYMMVSTYGDGKKAGTPRVVTDLAPDTVIKNRSVIVIDDVLDKGATANFVIKHLQNRGAAKVILAVLADKKTKRLYPIEADYRCLEVDDIWLSGMGMDNASTSAEADRWKQEILAHTN